MNDTNINPDERVPLPVKPRVVVVFDSGVDFDEMKSYAKVKGLDMKNFLMSSAKSQMLKYPLKTASKPKGA
ncbi:MAG: hypothetical protein LBT39_00115 [Treponema sp.]|jgi:predicted RNA-binding protein|nr:hypothetical protein [Treponema sp.]